MKPALARSRAALDYCAMALPWLAFLPPSDAEAPEGAHARIGRNTARTISQPLPETDADVITRVQKGDAVAMDAMFTTYYADLVSYAMSYLHEHAAAEDVAQDVFVRIWERRHEWTVRGSVAQYLFGATRNRALNVLAHDRVVARDTERVLRHHETEPVAVENLGTVTLEAEELARTVARVVDALPPRCQEVFILSRYQRISQREIAELLGITINTVNVQLGKALRALDATLRKSP
jgi:RNA polymerase sigma-70 factor (ECF subfamily)